MFRFPGRSRSFLKGLCDEPYKRGPTRNRQKGHASVGPSENRVRKDGAHAARNSLIILIIHKFVTIVAGSSISKIAPRNK